MTAAASYARALYELAEEHPRSARAYLKHMREALKRRGQSKLLPTILSEYQKLQTAAARRTMYATVTPEMERTRILLELYRKLIS